LKAVECRASIGHASRSCRASIVVRTEGDDAMMGFITERDLEQAEKEFPGIEAFFGSLANKPRTFLELVAAFEHWSESSSTLESAAGSAVRPSR
jgi:hypothetical protein